MDRNKILEWLFESKDMNYPMKRMIFIFNWTIIWLGTIYLFYAVVSFHQQVIRYVDMYIYQQCVISKCPTTPSYEDYKKVMD